jgi:hypothetical protein
MPEVLVQFSWEMEVVVFDNYYNLDVLVSCKVCYDGSFLFENDGKGPLRTLRNRSSRDSPITTISRRWT